MNTFWQILFIVWTVATVFNFIVLSVITLVDSSGRKYQHRILLLILLALVSLLGPLLWIFGEVYHRLYSRGFV